MVLTCPKSRPRGTGSESPGSLPVPLASLVTLSQLTADRDGPNTITSETWSKSNHGDVMCRFTFDQDW